MLILNGIDFMVLANSVLHVGGGQSYKGCGRLLGLSRLQTYKKETCLCLWTYWAIWLISWNGPFPFLGTHFWLDRPRDRSIFFHSILLGTEPNTIWMEKNRSNAISMLV